MTTKKSYEHKKVYKTEKPVKGWGQVFADRFDKTTERIQRDISNGKVEGYVVFILSISIAIIGLITTSSELMLAMVLTALGFIVYNMNISDEENLPNLNKILVDRDAFFKSFDKTLEERKPKVVWIYGASLINILNGNALDTIRDCVLHDKDHEVRILVQDPLERHNIELLKLHLDNKPAPAVQIKPSLKTTITSLRTLAEWKRLGILKGKFEYRYLKFCPGFSIVIFDPKEPTGLVTPEFYAFRNDKDALRMHIEITDENSHYWYEYWIDQFEEMWKSEKGKYIRIPDDSDDISWLDI